MTTTRTYEHFVYAKDRDAADHLVDAYREAGYDAETLDLDPVTVCTVKVHTAYDEDIRDQVERIAQEHDAFYDGGGMDLTQQR